MFAITLGYPVAVNGVLKGVAAVNVPVNELQQLANVFNVSFLLFSIFNIYLFIQEIIYYWYSWKFKAKPKKKLADQFYTLSVG